MMKLWFRSKAYRVKLDLSGYTAYATDEGALIPWPEMRRIMQTLQETKEYIDVLAEEITRWHNQIPDGQERVETIRSWYGDAVEPFERISSVNDAFTRAEARSQGEGAPVKRRR
jgi:hypothetical protein